MKKIFFIAALSVAGLISAKGNADKKIIKKSVNTEKKAVNKKASKRTKVVVYNWIRVISPCGAVYYLEASDYNSVESFTDDVIYFNAQKCGTSYPLA